jgi:hypothetical protein
MIVDAMREFVVKEMTSPVAKDGGVIRVVCVCGSYWQSLARRQASGMAVVCRQAASRLTSSDLTTRRRGGVDIIT